MRKLIGGIWIRAAAAACLLGSGTAIAADQTVDEFEAAQQAAWNAHDANAYTAAFDRNAEIVTALGGHWTGQAEAASNLGGIFQSVYARARLRVADVQIRMATPELASVTLSWSIDAGPAGVRNGFETQLLQRRGEHWLVLAQQDTAVQDTAVAPLPAASYSPEPATRPAATLPATPPPIRRCVLARGNGDCLIYGKAKPPPAP